MPLALKKQGRVQQQRRLHDRGRPLEAFCQPERPCRAFALPERSCVPGAEDPLRAHAVRRSAGDRRRSPATSPAA